MKVTIYVSAAVYYFFSTPPLASILYITFPHIYDRMSLATQSMSKTCDLLRLIVGDCGFVESYGWFLSEGNAYASHMLY